MYEAAVGFSQKYIGDYEASHNNYIFFVKLFWNALSVGCFELDMRVRLLREIETSEIVVFYKISVC